MMLQGDLQRVFDALYKMGVIEPVLQMDWAEHMENMPQFYTHIKEVVEAINNTTGGVERLMPVLKEFDQRTLGFLAMEVAREFADFHARKEIH